MFLHTLKSSRFFLSTIGILRKRVLTFKKILQNTNRHINNHVPGFKRVARIQRGKLIYCHHSKHRHVPKRIPEVLVTRGGGGWGVAFQVVSAQSLKYKYHLLREKRITYSIQSCFLRENIVYFFTPKTWIYRSSMYFFLLKNHDTSPCDWAYDKCLLFYIINWF